MWYYICVGIPTNRGLVSGAQGIYREKGKKYEEYYTGVSITQTEGPFGTDWAFF